MVSALRRLPLTAVGWLAAGLAVVCLIAGWQLGWLELTVLGTGCAIALAFAIPFVLGRMRLTITRRLVRERIRVGETADAEFEFHNDSGRPSRGRTLLDRISADGEAPTVRVVRVPALGAGATALVDYELDGLHRGRYQLGPAVIGRSDPLQLVQRDDARTGTDVLWVHPRSERVGALPVGFAKDLEGPTTETSPAGDVAFHSLREYEFGDDVRHIHWLSTARTRTPMVRHYVDNRRPSLAVLLDNRDTIFDADTFELAIEIVASLVDSAFAHSEPVAVWANEQVVVGKGASADRDQAFDRLALLGLSDTGDPLTASTLLPRFEPGVSAVALVTGAIGSAQLLPVVRSLRRRVRVIVIRVWPIGQVTTSPIPGANTLDVDSLESFTVRWRGLVG